MIIYHHSSCSKSRSALDLLREKKIPFEVIEYFKKPFQKEELSAIIRKLGIHPEELIRKNEKEYKQIFPSKEISEDDWIEGMLRHPKLIQRPIVVNGDKAVIARPAERILELL
jgi:arsenate reductase